MFKKAVKKIVTFDYHLTVKVRIIATVVIALALTMAFWGFIQLRVLDKILVDQQVQRLEGVAETVSSFYSNFPTKQGLMALDSAMKDHLQADVRLARIDIFELSRGSVIYAAGASRVHYEWPDSIIAQAVSRDRPVNFKLTIEGYPALGLLYTVASLDKKDSRIVVAVITFSRAYGEIMTRAGRLLILSSIGLLLFVLLVFGFSYGWIIGRPLSLFIDTIDASHRGKYIKRIPIIRRDEWGQLAEHFNMMADEIQAVMAKNLDLTKHLEERVKEETHKVVQLQKEVDDLKQLTALGHLTANLAHDLGTPLHSIAGLAKLMLEREGWPPDVAHKLQLIVQQTERLDNVIQNVRRATRMPDPHFEIISVEKILNETLPLIVPLMERTDVFFNVKVDPEIAPLYVDRFRIQTALFNIIQNALEAMPDGGQITITACGQPQERMASITVKDEGRGMSSEMIGKACQPFYSTHKDKGIRGLGLAIVSDIVKAHGGKLEIESSPSAGTSITMYLPATDDFE